MASILNRNGRWRALVRKNGRTACRTFARKSLAQEWALQTEANIDSVAATGTAPATGSLGDLIDRYVREVAPRKQWGRSKSADLARLKADLGDKPVAKLSKQLVVEYFTDRSRNGAGPVTISSQIGYLITVLKLARDLWSLAAPVAEVQEARDALKAHGLIGKGRKRESRVSDDLLERLIAEMERARTTSLPVRDIAQFLLASGMRLSEVFALRWTDLDVQARTVLVRDRKHPREKLGNNQVVPLTAVTGLDAFEIAKRQPRTTDRIFPFNGRTFSTYFARAVDALGIEGDVCVHSLRHECCSRLAAAGLPIPLIAQVSGHRDWAMLRRYTRLTAGDVHAWVSKESHQ